MVSFVELMYFSGQSLSVVAQLFSLGLGLISIIHSVFLCRCMFQNKRVCLCIGMLMSCFFPQGWCLSTCLQCFQMCCTVRESLSPSVWLCCSMTKSWCPQNSLPLLTPPSFCFIATTLNGCHSSARRSWSVFWMQLRDCFTDSKDVRLIYFCVK